MSFKEMWDKAGEDADEYEPAAGGHKVVIVGGSAFTSRAGDDYCKVELQELEGENAGRRFEHFMGFKHEVGARINREALITYGLENPEAIHSIEDLDDQIARLKGRTADVSVGYKDGYMQIRVSGSRSAPENAKSDIPANGYVAGMEDARKQQTDFAAQAATQTDDTLPFHHIDVSWDDRYHSAR